MMSTDPSTMPPEQPQPGVPGPAPSPPEFDPPGPDVDVPAPMPDMPAVPQPGSPTA